MTRKTMNERRMAGANKQIAQLTEALGAERKQRVLDDEKSIQISAAQKRVIAGERAAKKELLEAYDNLSRANYIAEEGFVKEREQFRTGTDKLKGKLFTARAIVIVLAAATVINIVLDTLGIPA